jgi:hypothetical protein
MNLLDPSNFMGFLLKVVYHKERNLYLDSYSPKFTPPALLRSI